MQSKGTRELLFSLSKKNGDFVVQSFKGSGKGGQKRNKTMSGCRIVHEASGTVSECQEERSFEQNKKKAFRRLVEKDSFQNWLKVEISKRNGVLDSINKSINEQMQPEFLKVEVKESGKWVEKELTS